MLLVALNKTFLMQYTRLNYIHYHQRYCHLHVFDVKKHEFYIRVKEGLKNLLKMP